MKNNTINDKELSSIFQEDAANHFPDEAIRGRLEYAFMVKSRGYKTTQNSFLGLFGWIFSWSNLPLKAAMVSFVLLFSLVNIKNVETPMMQQLQDTTQNMVPFHIDSSQTSPFFVDSCLTSKTIKNDGNNQLNSNSEIRIFNPSQKILSTTHFLSNPDSNLSFALPIPCVLPDLRISQKQQSTGLNNTTPAEQLLLV